MTARCFICNQKLRRGTLGHGLSDCIQALGDRLNAVEALFAFQGLLMLVAIMLYWSGR